MSSPFFSIVIPTYNRQDFILKTIGSVLNQTFKDFEIIVVDKCSTDDTEDLLTPLIQSGAIRYIKHDRNYERAASRNTGMKNAHGRFLTFLDSDDILYPNNLETAYHFIKSHPNAKFFHSLYELIDTEGKVLYRYRFPSVKNAIQAITEGNFISCIGFFVAEEVYTYYSFDTSEVLQGIEDWEFSMRILARYPIARIPYINAGIVHHGSRSNTQFKLESYVSKMDYVVGKFKRDPLLQRIYGKHLNRFRRSCFLLIASQANTSGFYDIASKYVRKAWLDNPMLIFNTRFLRIAQISFMRIKGKL